MTLLLKAVIDMPPPETLPARNRQSLLTERLDAG